MIKIRICFTEIVDVSLSFRLQEQGLCDRFKSKGANFSNPYKNSQSFKRNYQINGCSLGLPQKSRDAIAPRAPILRNP